MATLLLSLLIVSLVSAINPPGNITLTNPSGTVTTELSLTRYIFSGKYHLNCEVEQGKWTFEPKLPSSLNFVKATGELSGTPLETLPLQQFTVTVSNEAGASSLVFNITVEECKYGFYIIRKVMNKAHVTFKHDYLLLEDKDITIGNSEVYYCLPPGKLAFSLTCFNNSIGECIGQVKASNDTVYIHMRLAKGESQQQVVKMTPSEPPTLSVRDNDVVVAMNTEFETVFFVNGIHGPFTFEPKLPDYLSYDNTYYFIRGKPKERGVFSFRVSVSNELGESSLVWSLYVDMCPEGKELLRIRGQGSIQGGYSLLDSSHQLVAREDLPQYIFNKNYCFPEGNYFFVMHGTEDVPRWDNSIHLVDAGDNVVEQFQKQSGEELQEERFVLGDVIAFNSSLRFTVADTMSAEWVSQTFDDSKWSEGSAGTWGTFTAKNAYFRKQFHLANPHAYSQVLIEMIVADPAEVFVNGNQLRSFTRKMGEVDEMATHLYFPSTFLVRDENQIAIVLHGQTGSTIQLNLRLHFITSPCLQPALSGTATSDEEQPNPKRPASGAFNYGFTWWEPHQLPVSLSYQLAKDDFITPSQMTIRSKRDVAEGRPLAFDVFGLIVDHRSDTVLAEDLIASISAEAFLVGVDVETVSLSPKRPYNAFRIQFTKSSNRTMLRVHGVSFLTCQEDTCPKVGGIPEGRVGSVFYRNCPAETYGVNQVVCGRKDVEPHWIMDSSMCLSVHAPKGSAFVDTGIAIQGLRKANLKNVREAVEEWMPSYLVKKDEIDFPVSLETTGDVLGLNLTMRITVGDDMGHVVQKVMTEQLNDFVKQMRIKLYSVGCTSFRITSKPTLYEAIPESSSNAGFVITTICCVIVAFACGYMAHKACSKKEPEKEPLV